MSNQDRKNQIGEGIDDLSEAIEDAMVQISGHVGSATVDISNTMVESAREITSVSQAFVKASGRLAREKAAQKFESILEEATLDHLLDLSEKRSTFEEKAKALPAGPAKRYALAMAEKIASEENKILEIAMGGGGIAGISGEIQAPSLEVAARKVGTGAALLETRGEPFAPPPVSAVDTVATEIESTPEISEGAAGPGDVVPVGSKASETKG